MKYTGRIIALLAMISSSIGWSTRHVIKYGNLSGSQIILLIIYATIGWFLGKQYDKAKFYSEKDILTGLYNRRFVYDKFSKLFHRSLKNSMKNPRLYKKEIGVAILYIDLDRFKLINDSLGHHIGDQILTCVSERLKVYADERDIVARIGGDEFVFVLYEAQSDQIKNKVEAILSALSTPYFLEENELYLTVSIGISQSPDHGQDINELIAKADTAMYRAKQQGKNQYQFYIEEMNADTLERLELEKHLHKAIEKNEFLLYYQPRIDLKTNTIIGMEALVRWQHPNRGLIPPLKFISVAEETGLIVPIGEWVLYTACKQNKEWQDAGFVPLRVSVNISARQFQNNLVATVKKILDKTGLAPQWLELEITESMLMINVDDAVQTLHQLKNLGVHLSIDDFGTGYSSLNYLKRFPIDSLKIDKSFVSDVLSDASIANAVITLGHNLNLQVIAEGIEKQEQAIALQKQNCDHGQGYFFSPPVSKQRFEHFLMGNSDNAALKISS